MVNMWLVVAYLYKGNSMFVYIVSNDNEQHSILKDDRTYLNVLHTSILFIQTREEIYLRLPHELYYLHKEKIGHSCHTVIASHRTNEIAHLYFSDYSENYSIFKKYAYTKDMVTIGSSIEYDIYIQDKLLQQNEIMIDLKTMSIRDTMRSSFCFLDGHITNESHIQKGSVLRLLNLQIVFYTEFVMINSCENIYVSLPLFEKSSRTSPIPSLELHSSKYQYRKVVLNDHFITTLDEPLVDKQREFNPLFFSMGPALTMSSASLLSGSIAAYNGFLNGRELIDLLPMILLPCVMLVSTVLWNPFQRLYEKRKLQKFNKNRIEQYTNYLTLIKDDINDFKDEYNTSIYSYLPSCNELLLNSSLAIQKNSQQDDYLLFRLGKGDHACSINLKHQFKLRKEDILQEKITTLKKDNQIIHETVTYVDLKKHQHITYISDKKNDSFILRILIQIVAYYSSSKYAIGFVARSEWINEHLYVLNIPHIFSHVTENRYISSSREECERMLRMVENDDRYLFLFVLDQSFLPKDMIVKGSMITFTNKQLIPINTDLVIQEESDSGIIEKENDIQKYMVDPLMHFDPYIYFSSIDQNVVDGIFVKPSFYDLYYVQNVTELEIENRYCSKKSGLKAVIGKRSTGEQIEIDLSENGNGPHGLIAGATGSGKSEFILTLIMSLAINYSPEELQFVLIDFKGGGLIQYLVNENIHLPHVIGTLHDLDVNEIERAIVSLRNECKKRESLFKQLTALSNETISDLSKYQQYWKEEYDIDRLASLVVIVDEFAELKKEYPDVLNDMISIARIGRSLGIHLILSTQKPAGIVNEQIWANCRFKICLRVSEKQDSLEVLHTIDASKIYDPGEFYFMYDDQMIHGYSGYINAIEDRESSSVLFIDHNLKEIKRIEEKKNNRTQLQAILDKIISLNRNSKQIPSLWLKELQSISSTEIFYDKPYYGILDDYYNTKQPLLLLEENKYTYFIIASHQEEKIRFINTLLYGIINVIQAKDEIYFLDDQSILKACIYDVKQFITSISSEENKKISKLIEHLKEKDQKEYKTYLFLSDLSIFYQANDENGSIFHELLEIAERKNITIFVFTSNTATIKYRDLLFMQERISLSNDNVQDLSSLFEMPVKGYMNKKLGYIKREHLLQFQMIDVSYEEFEKCCKENKERFKEYIPYQLPFLPKNISMHEYSEGGYALGKNIYDYSWCTVHQNESLVVVSTYEEEQLFFYELYKNIHPCVLRFYNLEDLRKVLFVKHNAILFMTVDLYQQLSIEEKNKIEKLLFIGEGFHDQYAISYRFKGKLNHNEGILFTRNAREVIQLVEKE